MFKVHGSVCAGGHSYVQCFRFCTRARAYICVQTLNVLHIYWEGKLQIRLTLQLALKRYGKSEKRSQDLILQIPLLPLCILSAGSFHFLRLSLCKTHKHEHHSPSFTTILIKQNYMLLFYTNSRYSNVNVCSQLPFPCMSSFNTLPLHITHLRLQDCVL